MNICQAIAKPDCSKPKVQKAQGIQKALVHLLIQSYATNTGDTVLDEESGKVQLENEESVILGSNTIPSILAKSAKYATLEFAGVKFSETGKDHLRHIGKDIIGNIKHQLSLLRNIVICEEKYKCTPDDFKAATRSQRKTSQAYSISHLKTKYEVLNEDKFDKAALTSTAEGKTITSTYLAKSVEMLEIGETITLDINNEMHLTPCKCDIKPYPCRIFSTPIRAFFDKEKGFIEKS